jgi:hypothetical protein
MNGREGDGELGRGTRDPIDRARSHFHANSPDSAGVPLAAVASFFFLYFCL